MATQRKLDKYFTITPSNTTNNKQKLCFIYEPALGQATFSSSALKTDQYVTKKVGVSLYYRQPNKKHIYPIPHMKTNASIPLLKSNLQKSIRRGLIHEALQSALAIIQRDPLEFLRRLPIIYIEDVCLQDSYSIVVWLMMAENDYTLDSMDIDLLLRIVKHLCDCTSWYDNSLTYINSDITLNPSMLEHSAPLLSLYYRSLYGGMKGDMIMLQNAMYYYLAQPSHITHTVLDEMDYDNIGSHVEILQEAIDFHPFPGILTFLEKHAHICVSDIKTTIWFADSAVNIRKSTTIAESIKYKKSKSWKAINPFISQARFRLYHD